MSSAAAARASTSAPTLAPIILLRAGQICLPGDDGPVVALDALGHPRDPFDVIDWLRGEYPFGLLVDLDGIERREPQLEYLQELSRDFELWVDAGVPTADAAIDILVAGAHRAVLSSAHLRGPVELRRAWKLSTEWVFEVEVGPPGQAVASPAWGTSDPVEIARAVRSTGIQDVIIAPRRTGPDWNIIRGVAAAGPTWVGGTFDPRTTESLGAVGAVGGFFYPTRFEADPPLGGLPGGPG